MEVKDSGVTHVFDPWIAESHMSLIVDCGVTHVFDPWFAESHMSLIRGLQSHTCL